MYLLPAKTEAPHLLELWYQETGKIHVRNDNGMQRQLEQEQTPLAMQRRNTVQTESELRTGRGIGERIGERTEVSTLPLLSTTAIVINH
jgi:hypothetical protein